MCNFQGRSFWVFNFSSFPHFFQPCSSLQKLVTVLLACILVVEYFAVTAVNVFWSIYAVLIEKPND